VVASEEGAASRFEDESLQRLEATVLMAGRTFVRLELPAPWASTTIPLPDSELEKGETVLVAGRADTELDQVRAPKPGDPIETQPGFRVLAVAVRRDDATRHLEVPWPSDAPAAASTAAPADIAPDENDWSDV
jgi:hypothetical protein